MLQRPRHSLRSRLVRSFLAIASSALLVSAAAVWIVDRSIRAEIQERTRAVEKSIDQVIRDRQLTLERATDQLARDPSLIELAREPARETALEAAADLASRLAPAYRLDLLLLSHEGVVVSNAHLPSSVGDPDSLPTQDGCGFTEELVTGNPPKLAPAIVCLRTTRLDPMEIRILAGTLIDERLLGALSEAAEARVVLRAPAAKLELGPPVEGPASTIQIPGVGGRGGAQLSVAVSAARLELARSRLLMISGAFVVLAFALALGLAELRARAITKPIEDLSTAAQDLAAGKDVRVASTAEGEVGALIRTFNSMVVDLTEARERATRAERVAAWREAARRIAHEIKNPLFPMRMSMETLRKAYAKQHPALGEILEESTQAVLDEVKSLERLVSEFAEFARLPSPKRAPLPASELLDHAARLFGSDVGKVMITIADRARDPSIPPVDGDKELLGRALTNLVKNAVEAIGARGGHVWLDVWVSDRERIIVAVKDDGPGMDEETRKKIFTPYFTTKTEGTGLGLSIVERIVAEHDGSIEVTSQRDKGTEIRLTLPAVRSASDKTEALVEVRPGGSPSTGSEKSPI